jgi:hypothetical protein
MDETDVLNNVFNSVFEDYKARLNTSVARKSAPKSNVEPKDVNEWMREQEEKNRLLDALFNPFSSTMAVPQKYHAQPLVGKSATHVWLDDPWDIA